MQSPPSPKNPRGAEAYAQSGNEQEQVQASLRGSQHDPPSMRKIRGRITPARNCAQEGSLQSFLSRSQHGVREKF